MTGTMPGSRGSADIAIGLRRAFKFGGHSAIVPGRARPTPPDPPAFTAQRGKRGLLGMAQWSLSTVYK